MMGTALRLLSGPTGRRLFRPIMRNRASIFMLHRLSKPEHGIGGHTIEQVEILLAALERSGARFVSLRTLIEQWRTQGSVDPDCVAFTMDDGFADQGKLAQAVFLQQGYPVTIFLITGFLDGKLWPWDDQLAYAFRTTPKIQAAIHLAGEALSVQLNSPAARRAALHRVREACKKLGNDNLYELVAQVASALAVSLPSQPPVQYRPLSWDETRALEAHGVEFGPHSVSHRIFSQLSPWEAHQEVAESWTRLQQELRNPVPVFAWPTGRSSDYSPRDVQIAQDIGLLGSVATDDDYAYAPKDCQDALYGIKRFALPDDVTTTLRYGSWLERVRRFLPG